MENQGFNKFLNFSISILILCASGIITIFTLLIEFTYKPMLRDLGGSSFPITFMTGPYLMIISVIALTSSTLFLIFWGIPVLKGKKKMLSLNVSIVLTLLLLVTCIFLVPAFQLLIYTPMFNIIDLIK